MADPLNDWLRNTWNNVGYQASRAGNAFAHMTGLGGVATTNPNEYDAGGYKKPQAPAPAPAAPAVKKPLVINYGGNYNNQVSSGATSVGGTRIYDTPAGPEKRTVETKRIEYGGSPLQQAATAQPAPQADATPDHVKEWRGTFNNTLTQMQQDAARFQPGTPEYERAIAAREAERGYGLRSAGYGLEGFAGSNAQRNALAANAQAEYSRGIIQDRTMLEQQAFDRRQQANGAILAALGAGLGYNRDASLLPFQTEAAALANSGQRTSNEFAERSMGQRLEAGELSNEVSAQHLDAMKREAQVAGATLDQMIAAKKAEYASIQSASALAQWEAENAHWLGILKGGFDLAKTGLQAAVSKGMGG